MSTLAIIPARAGSRRIAHKNKRPLGAMPLWRYAADAAIAAGIADVWISSDDPEIRADAIALGCSVYRECPGEFGTMRLLRDEVVRFSRARPDFVVMLLPTYPFRSARDVFELLGRLSPHIDEVQSATWVARCSLWLPNSYLAAVRWDNGACTGVHPPRNQLYFGIDHRRGTDIDTEDDWARAERLLPAFDFATGEWRDERIGKPAFMRSAAVQASVYPVGEAAYDGRYGSAE